MAKTLQEILTGGMPNLLDIMRSDKEKARDRAHRGDDSEAVYAQRLHFVGKIRENLDDQAPRLVFADWLDDFGGPRGAWQARMIRGQWGVGGPARLATTFPEVVRLTRSGYDRFGPRPAVQIEGVSYDVGWPGPSAGLEVVHFRKGFVDELRLRPESWFRYANFGKLLDLHPVRAVRLLARPAFHCRDTLERGVLAYHLSGGGVVRKYGYSTSEDFAVKDLLTAEWPGIAFDFPQRATAGATS